MADIQNSLDTEKKEQITTPPKENPLQETSSFLKSFFELKEIQIDLLPQIQLSENDRKDLEGIIMQSDYICKCFSHNFLVKRDQWTICSYQYLVLAKEAYSFANQLNIYCKFFNKIQDQEDLKILYDLKRSIHEDIKKASKKKGSKSDDLSDEVDPDDVPVNIDKKIVLETLNSSNILEELNKTNFFNSYNGDKDSLRDFLLNPQVKQIISKKKNDVYKQRSDVFSSNILTAFPIVVAHNGFLGDLVYFLANNDDDYQKVINIVDNAKQISNPFLGGNLFQEVFFGAPGTGKSHKIDFDLFRDENGNSIGKGIKEISKDCKFRTTFHPDYDYAQFVGAYKPKRCNSDPEKITYSFVPQVFAKAYAAAWRLYLKGDPRLRGDDNEGLGNDSEEKDIRVFLVIEEINRGNCAQIFGDIFQLLDRDGDGFSQYTIDADCDFADWLENDEAGLKSVWDKYKDKVGEGKLKLPPNLNILATMNTSDQSLFPMDSAFKRRFDWEYVPISFTDEEGNEKEAAAYQIDIDGSPYPWKDFVETVNEKILTLTESEDKQLGEFFIKPDNGNVISKDRFLGKVMFYLWNEVCKDEHKNGSFFRVKSDGKEEYFTFQDLYKKQGLLKLFMDELLKKE